MAVTSKIDGPLWPVKGIRFAAVAAGVRYANRADLVLFELTPGASVAAVFTRNAFCAAPVQVARQHWQGSTCRYLLVNTGNANAGTGPQGLEDARACCAVVARSATEREGVAVDDSQVLPFSTGVIGQRLPVATIVAGIPAAFAALVEDDWIAAARGIMTTDTRPKAVSRRVAFSSGETVTITGIAKGAGMLKPNMATMLAFVFTDARVEAQSLQVMLNQITNESFNRITVDGDTSTNDACLLVATGVSGVEISPNRQPDHDDFVSNLRAVFLTLATELIRDAEGATKFVTVIVEGGASSDECLAVAYAIAESPLVKTALFASDPNWGRILAAIGRAGLKELNIDRLTIDLGETRLVENGGLAASYTEEAGQTEMDREEITVTVNLARGTSKEIVWTSDLSQDYVRINADYRS